MLPGSPVLNATANKIGISASTLFGGKKIYAKTKLETGSWTSEQKLQVINEIFALSANELGEVKFR